MIELVLGAKHNPFAADELIRIFEGLPWSGTLYLGYPILASVDNPVVVDALLTCREHGVVAFDLSQYGDGPDTVAEIRDHQDDVYTALQRKLLDTKALRSGRQLAVPLNVITVVPNGGPLITEASVMIASVDDIVSTIEPFDPITDNQLRSINAAIQRIATIKPPNKRTNVARPNSRGAIMKKIEAEIANLDRWQKSAAIESPDGPQRIRGLAGSGKTIVLALKAAYLHTRHPEWRIAVTFNTRSLYQQFKDLIRRFCFEHLNDEPDWDKLTIMHAWGGTRQRGIYYEVATSNSILARDYDYGKRSYGPGSAFEGVCNELVSQLKQRAVLPLYDALLIDEAQDLPQSFFEVAFLATKDPKRIVWAYDELQNLSAYSMAPPSELFGTDVNGTPRIPHLGNQHGAAKEDIVLPVCYRNTPWALATAHAVGFGVYRKGGLVQFFDEPSLWHDVGYRVLGGALAGGSIVELARRPEASPDFFEDLISKEDAVTTHHFMSQDEQAEWVAHSIYENIRNEELELKDILIIPANPLTIRSEAARLIKALGKYEIAAHLAGVTSSVDEIFSDESIAISSIYRAKGNEAAMVYILNSEHGLPAYELIKRRNILFTAITRSRAWVRLCGCGDGMRELNEEIQSVRDNNFHLRFHVPTPDELQAMRRIHRDMTPGEREQLQKAQEGLAALTGMLSRGEVSRETLPPEIRRQLDLFAEALGYDS